MFQKRPLPHSNPDLVCPDCQRVFQRPCGLAKHRKTCPNRQTTSADVTSRNTEVVCPKCQRRFKRPCGLGRHIKSCTGGQEQPPLDASASENRDEGQHLIKCPDCPCTFKRPSGLASHRRAHHRTQREDAPNSVEVILTSTGPSLQSPNITTEACQTQQSAGQATSPRTPHSASDCSAEIFQHRPTQNLKEASAEQFHLRERLVFPPASNKQFWSSTDSALDAVLQQECPGFDQLPPLEALSH